MPRKLTLPLSMPIEIVRKQQQQQQLQFHISARTSQS